MSIITVICLKLILDQKNLEMLYGGKHNIALRETFKTWRKYDYHGEKQKRKTQKAKIWLKMSS